MEMWLLRLEMLTERWQSVNKEAGNSEASLLQEVQILHINEQNLWYKC